MAKNNSTQSPHLNWTAFPWHVFLLSAFPVLALLGHNITEVTPGVALIPLAISIFSAGDLFLVWYAIRRNWQRAALITSILVVMFFLYGHVYASLKGIIISGNYLFRHRTLAPIWLILTGLGTWWAWRIKSDLKKWTLSINLFSVILIIMPVIQIGSGVWARWNAWNKASQSMSTSALPDGTTVSVQEMPDIYYIILDSYGRTDKIKDLYDYDNSEFLNSLQEQGFYIANCSQSNYNQTELSLSTSLNFNYIEALGNSFTPANADRSPLWPLIRNSAIRQFLESRGYRTVAFQTAYAWSEISDADYYLAPHPGTWELNGFQYLYLQTTAARILLDAESLRLPNTIDDIIRRNTQFALEKLKTIPTIEGPKFIFAHILVPHSFVFGPNGEPIAIDVSTMTPEIFKKGYVDSLIFIDRQIEEVVATIIATSPTPPIIIIQGDHGPAGDSPETRDSILNVYYLPEKENLLYSTITPVNTFRVILDGYFEQQLPLLPDISNYATYQKPYDYFVVSNNCSNK